MPHEVPLPLAPVDQQVLRQEHRNDHPQPVVHPAGLLEAPHRGIHDRIPGIATLPRLKILRRVPPRESVVVGVEIPVPAHPREAHEHMPVELAPEDLLHPAHRTLVAGVNRASVRVERCLHALPRRKHPRREVSRDASGLVARGKIARLAVITDPRPDKGVQAIQRRLFACGPEVPVDLRLIEARNRFRHLVRRDIDRARRARRVQHRPPALFLEFLVEALPARFLERGIHRVERIAALRQDRPRFEQHLVMESQGVQPGLLERFHNRLIPDPFVPFVLPVEIQPVAARRSSEFDQRSGNAVEEIRADDLERDIQRIEPLLQCRDLPHHEADFRAPPVVPFFPLLRAHREDGNHSFVALGARAGEGRVVVHPEIRSEPHHRSHGRSFARRARRDSNAVTEPHPSATLTE